MTWSAAGNSSRRDLLMNARDRCRCSRDPTATFTPETISSAADSLKPPLVRPPMFNSANVGNTSILQKAGLGAFFRFD